MIKAICQWFRDVFGPLTEDEQIAMARDIPDLPRLSIPYLRAEIQELQAMIALAKARHKPIAHLRRLLARRIGELLVAVS